MKKLVILNQANITKVENLAKQISDPRAKKGDFSRALRKIIDEYK